MVVPYIILVLLAATIRWANFDWATVPSHHSYIGTRTKAFYEKVTLTDSVIALLPGGFQPFNLMLVAGTKAIVQAIEVLVFRAMQLIVDFQANALIVLTLLVFEPQTLCWSRLFGHECNSTHIELGDEQECSNPLDGAMQYSFASLWFLVCGFPSVFFFMPMLFGTRVDGDWKLSKLIDGAYSEAPPEVDGSQGCQTQDHIVKDAEVALRSGSSLTTCGGPVIGFAGELI
eukprot:scaffold40184_cov63-Phaeocystis_antarctica.AAC.3